MKTIEDILIQREIIALQLDLGIKFENEESIQEFINRLK